MTDNEKAATYTGWGKGRACRIFISGSGNKCICGYELPAISSWSHEECAPDMTLPANYMRALEEVSRTLRFDVGFGHEEKGAYCDIGDDNGTAQPCYTGYGKTFGEAVVKALAALYDVEHKE